MLLRGKLFAGKLFSGKLLHGQSIVLPQQPVIMLPGGGGYIVKHRAPSKCDEVLLDDEEMIEIIEMFLIARRRHAGKLH